MNIETKMRLDYLQKVIINLNVVKRERYLNLMQDTSKYEDLLRDIESKKDEIIEILSERKN